MDNYHISEWKQNNREERKESIALFLGALFLVLAFAATLWMYHENAVIGTMVRLSIHTK